MSPEREAEIRTLAARFMAGKRHRRIGLVLCDLLAELDALRADEGPHMSFDEAMAMVMEYARDFPPDTGSASRWAEAVRAVAENYPLDVRRGSH